MGSCLSADTLEYVSVSLVRQHRAQQSFGLALERPQARGALLVKGIDEEGLMAQWNAEHPNHEVAVGDRVVLVNGVLAHDGKLIWEMIDQHQSRVDLVVARSAQSSFKGPTDFLDALDDDCTSAVGSDECAICLEPLEGDCVVFPCRHALHRECARAWVASCKHVRSTSCPTCRKPAHCPALQQGKIAVTTRAVTQL